MFPKFQLSHLKGEDFTTAQLWDSLLVVVRHKSILAEVDVEGEDSEGDVEDRDRPDHRLARCTHTTSTYISMYAPPTMSLAVG